MPRDLALAALSLPCGGAAIQLIRLRREPVGEGCEPIGDDSEQQSAHPDDQITSGELP